MIVSNYGWVDTALWSRQDLDKLRDRFTLIPRQDSRSKDPSRPLHLYHEVNNLIGIPRMHSLVGKLSGGCISLDGISDGDPVNLEFNGTPRDDQPEAINSFLNYFARNQFGGGILQAVGAWGKTVAMMQLIAKLNKTTLVLAHRDFLIEQWQKTCEDFLPKARVGIIQQSKCEFKNKDIVIASIKTLTGQREFPKEMYNRFGLVIADEVHVFGARSFSEVVPKFTARYRVGLSATPRRLDKCENAFKWHIGDILFTTKKARMKGRVKRIYTGWEPYVTQYQQSYQSLPDYVAIRQMIADYDRNKLIIDELVKALDAGRKIVVFSSRIKHLRTLREMLIKQKPEIKSCFFIGGEGTLEDTLENQVIFATYEKASAAWNVEDLDTEFFVTPRGDIEQAWYRIIRWKEGKKIPIAVYFIDEKVRFCMRLWEYCKNYFERIGAFDE